MCRSGRLIMHSCIKQMHTNNYSSLCADNECVPCTAPLARLPFHHAIAGEWLVCTCSFFSILVSVPCARISAGIFSCYCDCKLCHFMETWLQLRVSCDANVCNVEKYGTCDTAESSYMIASSARNACTDVCVCVCDVCNASIACSH